MSKQILQIILTAVLLAVAAVVALTVFFFFLPLLFLIALIWLGAKLFCRSAPPRSRQAEEREPSDDKALPASEEVIDAEAVEIPSPAPESDCGGE